MTKNLFIVAIPAAAIIVLTACSKPAEPAAPAATHAASAANDTAAEVKQQASEVKATTENAVKEVAKAPETVKPAEATPPPAPVSPDASKASTQVQDTFTRVKTLIGEKKYPEALAALSELSNAVLTPEQQTAVAQLKTQIQSLMASDAGKEGLKAVNGLLNQKK